MRNGTLIQLCAGRYYQGSGVLSHLGEDAALLGTRMLLVADRQVWPQVSQPITRVLEQHGLSWQVFLFSGFCCPANYQAAQAAGQALQAQAVIGVGGGSALDAAKIAADRLGVRCITVPTSAATCAASAWLAVEYTDQGAFVGNYWAAFPPFAVVADLDILLGHCPPRYHIIGFVDAMACGGKQAAVSHSLYSYFCTCHPEIRARFLHGELVGASLVYQLAVNGASEEEQAHLEAFLRQFSLPACLADLGLADSPQEREALFTFLAGSMPVTDARELERLQSKADLLFHGLPAGRALRSDPTPAKEKSV